MQITQELIEKFSRLRMRTDARQIAEANGVSVILIHKAFSSGKCSQRVLDMLVKFYDEREKKVDAIINNINEEA